MKRYSVILVLLLIVMVTACSGKTEQAVISSEEMSFSDNSASGVEIATEREEKYPKPEDEDLSLFENFLKNETEVTIGSNDLGEYFSFGGQAGQSYTLKELVNAIIAGYVGDSNSGVRIRLESIEYAYIDCGNDGKKELALKIYTPSSDEWTEYLIIRENNGALETIYSNVAWARSRICINEYGYFYNDGSGGASSHGFDKSFIDAEGHYHYIYSVLSNGFAVDENFGADLWFNDDIQEIPPNSEIDGTYVFLSFDFDNTPEDESDNYFSYAKYEEPYEGYEPGDGFRSYFYAPLSDDESIYSEVHPLKKYYESKYLKTYTLKEIDQMIADKEGSEGLSEEIKNGKAADWNKLEIAFEPFIASYNDDNILGVKEFFPLGFLLCAAEGFNSSLNISADGSIQGHYYGSRYSDEDTGDSYYWQNECTGQFVLEGLINDHIFKLRLTNVELVHPISVMTAPGVRGHNLITYYVEIPGLDDDGKEYLLYGPGTTIDEIEERAMWSLPEYAKERHFEGDTLTQYLLYEIDGNNNVWRWSGY